MKLLLTATGFSNEALICSAEKAIGKKRKDISVAIINEAYTVEVGDKAWVIDEMYTVAHTFNKFVDLVDLLGLKTDEVMRRVSQCDMVYLVGGSAEYLMKVMIDTRLKERFDEFVGNRLLVGSSAGAMVLGNRAPVSVYDVLYEDKQDFSLSNYYALVPHVIIPHFKESNFESIDEAKLNQVSSEYNVRLDGLNNDQGILYVDGSTEYINGEPYTVIPI